MCGIVAFFGDAGNNITRVLTAMSAITYRAPDSTGLGVFGDELVPIRVRKSLGSVAPLVGALIMDPAYPDVSEGLKAAAKDPAEPLQNAQRRLLQYESLPMDTLDSVEQGHEAYCSFEDLVAVDKPLVLEPGRPGRPGPLPEVRIRSRKQFQRVIQELTFEYDLSPVVVWTLIRRALAQALERDVAAGNLTVLPLEILNAFDRLFDTASREERSPRPQRLYGGTQPDAPYAERYLWQYLVSTPVQIPADYDRDGVRCLFRLLDAALLSRIHAMPGLADAVQDTMDSQWPEMKVLSNTGGWRALYWAEKSVNVFGRAASAVLSHLRQSETLPVPPSFGNPDSRPAKPGHGRTDPLTLRSLASPVLSQGRWAMQSPVTLKNGHPFFDQLKQRAIVLNGQFSGDLEENLRLFLEHVAGYEFRSRNSSEYFALLWGYCFEVFSGEQSRYKAVLAQIDRHLETFGAGSRSIDYEIYQRLRGKSQAELDGLAFVRAARCMGRQGGQIAVSGMSLFSPRTLYVASHNRPVFVVQREGTQDLMVVSDINAAMGLFPQKTIHEKVLELYRLQKRHHSVVEELRNRGASKDEVRNAAKTLEQEEKRILETFLVKVYPLEGEEIFARLEATATESGPARIVTITDFEGAPLPSIEPFQARLNPLQTGKDIHRSFYETHLLEVPERFENILQFHVSEEAEGPRFDLKEGLLRRRFGRHLTSLGRVVLMGMGSAHHAGIMARRSIQSALPGIDVVSLRPVEVDDLKRLVIPEKDLVVLLSWSGTTADMVRAANELSRMNAACIGVTEKAFSDLGLVASRSVGVIPVLSGEEVTIPGLKSILCMMFNVSLFAVWLSSRARPGMETGSALMAGLKELPDVLSHVLHDENISFFCRDLAAKSANSRTALVIDALYSTGAGREAAFKLEEISWNAIGRSMDYREAAEALPGHVTSGNLVLVNATNQARISEALDIMRELVHSNTPFAVVGFAGRHQAEMEKACQGRFVSLPKVQDELQPFVDLAFYYRLAFHYGLAHGRTSEDFPRNRAKSVTAGRSSQGTGLTPAGEIQRMEATGAASAECDKDLPPLSSESLWELAAASSPERDYYKSIRMLALAISENGGPEAILETSRSRPFRLAKALFEQAPDEGEMLLVPMDRAAHSTARTLSVQWDRFLGCGVRVAAPEDIQAHHPQDVPSFFLACRKPDPVTLSAMIEQAPSPCFYCGPELPEDVASLLDESLGHCVLLKEFQACSGEALYAGLSLLFVDAWKRVNPARGETAHGMFRHCCPAINAVLNSRSLRDSITGAVLENRGYKTAFFIGQPGGVGSEWVRRFDESAHLAMESYLFGESVHGPLVTVDSRVDDKYVRIEARAGMIETYGADLVVEWESCCLKGGTIDDFLAVPPRNIPLHAQGPFYAEGNWYLPVLRSDYNAENDNLILMDATNDRFLGQILDEMATYGCRYARVILLSQQALEARPERKTLYRYPIGHVLNLPSLSIEGRESPIQEPALPLVLNLLGMAMASDTATVDLKTTRRWD